MAEHWTLDRDPPHGSGEGSGYHCHILYDFQRTQFITTMKDGIVFMCFHGERTYKNVNIPGADVLAWIKIETINLLLQFDEQGACLVPGKKCFRRL